MTSDLHGIIIFLILTGYFYYFRKSFLILYFVSFHKAFKLAEKFVILESNFCDLESEFGAQSIPMWTITSTISLRIAISFSWYNSSGMFISGFSVGYNLSFFLVLERVTGWRGHFQPMWKPAVLCSEAGRREFQCSFATSCTCCFLF